MGGSADLGAELFCATGWGAGPLADHAEFLLQQHEAGALRLHDRGALDPADPATPRRWRMTWQRPEGPVSAVLALLRGREQARVWFAARCPAGWGAGIPSPLIRAGLARFPLADPGSGLAVTGSTVRDDPDDLPGLLAAVRDRRSETAVLVRHLDREPGSPLAVPRPAAEFRAATAGCAVAVFVGDEVARRLDAELPAPQRIPWRGARLFLPGPWSAESDPELSEGEAESAAAWPALADLALRIARRREPGSATADAELWSLLLAGGWHDERVADSPVGAGERWFAGEGDKSALRKRIQSAAAREAESREVVARRSGELEELDAELGSATARLASLELSRRRLAGGALRLRAQRDAARERLAGTALGLARHRVEAARRLSRVRADRLDECERELERLRDREARLLARAGTVPDEVPTPSEPAGLRFGPEVLAEIDELDPARARRCAQALDLLAAYAAEPDGAPAARLRAGGIPPLALGRADPAAATFRVPAELAASGWAVFDGVVRLDHAGEPAILLHYLDDTAGPTAAVHVHVGPDLAGGAR
ncbi:hypothetical protein ACL03H_06945 [Saccharopolyspora sp. MS10]|uniref:hypothetical protein n=1 Tax=Saccharopolyspora sp. MS10 TaxID=3385973 RepID=UPI0039A37C21